MERFTPHVVELLLSCLRLLVTGEQTVAGHVDKKSKTAATAKESQPSASAGTLHQPSSALPVTGRVDPVSLQQVNNNNTGSCRLQQCSLYAADGHGV